MTVLEDLFGNHELACADSVFGTRRASVVEREFSPTIHLYVVG